MMERHPDICWRAVDGFRNVAAHGYLNLRLDLEWEIIEQHLPALTMTVRQELGQSPPI
jgi:uncharacterized protein with HEPN domain